jgi:tetratricopeptide (TPR) repeat protein
MWSRRSIEALFGVLLLAAVAACSVTPKRAVPAPPAPAIAHAGAPAAAGQPAAAGPPPVPAAAREAFAKALALAHAGNDAAAEEQLASLAHQYPQFCTPLVDLGILYRNDAKLDAAMLAFRRAVGRRPGDARAWTELGVTQRLSGKFKDAEGSYERAIAANPSYAPAYRDRGVLRDLYLNEPTAALSDFEQYRKLTGEDKPVAMWIAELQHRTRTTTPARN